MKRPWYITFLLFFWLATAYGFLHVCGLAWLSNVLSPIWNGPTQFHDQIQVTEDGEAVIQSGNNREINFRQLDGTPIQNSVGVQSKFVQQSAGFSKPIVFEPLSWSNRMSSFGDFQRPLTCWYLVNPPHLKCRAFFVGYGKSTRQLVGYIGIQGFMSTPPTAEESFPIETSVHWAFHGNLTSSQGANMGRWVSEPGEWAMSNYIPRVNVKPDAVWLLSAGKIYEILLGERTVRVLVDKPAGMTSLAGVTVTKQDDKSYFNLLARTDEAVITIDPETGSSQSIPTGPLKGSEWFYSLKSGQRVHTTSEWVVEDHRQHGHYTVQWIAPDNQIERTTELDLNSSKVERAVLIPPAFLPLPLASFGGWVISSIFQPRMKESIDFGPWMIISLIVGIAAGWACYLRERDVFQSGNLLMPIAVGLGGWFGWIGYSFVRPLPARQANRQWMPARPEPNLPIGTEIFA